MLLWLSWRINFQFFLKASEKKSHIIYEAQYIEWGGKRSHSITSKLEKWIPWLPCASSYKICCLVSLKSETIAFRVEKSVVYFTETMTQPEKSIIHLRSTWGVKKISGLLSF